MLKYLHEFLRSWDTHFTVPTFEFNFKLPIPKANKERLIIERNELGQIIHSKVPPLFCNL
ncbi:MAG: hypothetical protein UV71_C0012G0018 [Microgenomates group bacterium GW2011_GWC1_43_13]|nr:MAG: hypothetical protein UV71_C0012G0018 [Microgenomates group bacterium GW2011_GWC1_43_13]